MAGKSGELDEVSRDDGNNGVGRILGGIGLSMMLNVVDWRGMSFLVKLISQCSSTGSPENCLTRPDSSLDLVIGSSLKTGVATCSGVDFVASSNSGHAGGSSSNSTNKRDFEY